ncbi:hypothetical protein E2562_024760 [Oryza meyeriana var. granulata]|uniref:Uncharacterized protein n=1 Tax=Oryza meyeriana var. granulata TaxID=110450 RepID=A0A6G1D7F5_9ORYZ|nr:hypothetical protein E2562_024760 [Oryza meyeriana var. granulata]
MKGCGSESESSSDESDSKQSKRRKNAQNIIGKAAGVQDKVPVIATRLLYKEAATSTYNSRY